MDWHATYTVYILICSIFKMYAEQGARYKQEVTYIKAPNIPHRHPSKTNGQPIQRLFTHVISCLSRGSGLPKPLRHPFASHQHLLLSFPGRLKSIEDHWRYLDVIWHSMPKNNVCWYGGRCTPIMSHSKSHPGYPGIIKSPLTVASA